MRDKVKQESIDLIMAEVISYYIDRIEEIKKGSARLDLKDAAIRIQRKYLEAARRIDSELRSSAVIEYINKNSDWVEIVEEG